METAYVHIPFLTILEITRRRFWDPLEQGEDFAIYIYLWIEDGSLNQAFRHFSQVRVHCPVVCNNLVGVGVRLQSMFQMLLLLQTP